jgi:hypothetical protein
MMKRGMRKRNRDSGLTGELFIGMSVVLIVLVIIFAGFVFSYDARPVQKSQTKQAVQLPQMKVSSTMLGLSSYSYEKPAYNYEKLANKKVIAQSSKVAYQTFTDDEKLNMKGYFDGTYRFKMYNPYSWQIVNNVDHAVVAFTKTSGKHGQYESAIVVAAQPLSQIQGKTLSQLTDDAMNMFETVPSKLQLFDSYDTTLSGENAHVLVFSAKTLEGRYLKIKTTYGIRQHYLYSVSYVTDGMNFQNDLEAADSIMSTFEFI